MLYLFAIALTAYYFLHSVFAASTVKSWIIEKANFPLRFYRLAYNILFLGLSLLLMWLYFQITKQTVFDLSPIWNWMGWGLIVLGIGIGIEALRHYNLSEFSGTYQMKNKKDYQAGTLQTQGLNRFVRHPLYLGILMAIWGLFLVIPNDGILVIASITTAYIYIGTKLEEKKLIEEFGDTYKNYQKEVPMVIPFLKWRRVK